MTITGYSLLLQRYPGDDVHRAVEDARGALVVVVPQLGNPGIGVSASRCIGHSTWTTSSAVCSAILAAEPEEVAEPAQHRRSGAGGHARTGRGVGQAVTCEPSRVLAVGRPGSIWARCRRRDQEPDGNGGREISSGTARGSGDTAPGRPASRVRAYPPMARASSCPGRPASSSQAATGHRTSINRCGETARPSGKSSPESSKRMTPLHSRLHPCSGWKATDVGRVTVRAVSWRTGGLMWTHCLPLGDCDVFRLGPGWPKAGFSWPQLRPASVGKTWC